MKRNEFWERKAEQLDRRRGKKEKIDDFWELKKKLMKGIIENTQ